MLPSAAMSETRLLSVHEAADRLCMLPARLGRLAKALAVPHIVLPDGEIRFDPGDLDDWVELHKQCAEGRRADNDGQPK